MDYRFYIYIQNLIDIESIIMKYKKIQIKKRRIIEILNINNSNIELIFISLLLLIIDINELQIFININK